ncbi:hypothetical protein F5B22DRAFT_170157 [Xylaria bambusicola]|uniref:uncharacterized protein n=1 Tax=Xylaria bambusicola TaxID=326684 RepID=UPI002007B805|nr:uncharacterized protein F5B22DRAFT_170157 [Xylaria bambusicola]KAI0526657.1 hypothetical protein F5B22DRAFT_170157 [Xylaria bambusicola]
MFSSTSASTNFKGLRRKAANDGSSSTFNTARPSTATSPEHSYSHGITDMLQPALDGPPSPEGIRAFSRRIKRRSVAEQQLDETAPSSGTSSLHSETPETSEHGFEDASLSRNPSQRSSAMAFRDRPESVQLFGKAVFSRKPKLRRELSDQSHSNSSFLSFAELPPDTTTDLSREQRFIQSMFTRRRVRGASEASMKKYQISGPYDFQHVSHASRENASALNGVNSQEVLPNLPGARSRTTTGASNKLGGINLQALDKPLPTPPISEDSEYFSPRNSIQFSPPRPLRYAPDVNTSPIPPPRTSSRISTRHDSIDPTSIATIEKPRTVSSHHHSQSFILPLTEATHSRSTSRTSDKDSEQYNASGNENSPYLFSTGDDTAWPLTSSMTSLPEVPEEEDYNLTTVMSRASVISTSTSLRGSISVPHLRRVSLSQATQRPPSNASDTLGRFDLFSTQRALFEFEEEHMDEIDFIRDNWEDDIDYCYEHAAEADCDFAWERLSCDLEREEYLSNDPIISHRVQASLDNFSSAPLSLSPTPASSIVPKTSNFSLPRVDTSGQLKHDHDRSHSSASSFQEVQGFSLSPSLLIPNEYHDKMLQYERGELSSHASSDELKLSHDQFLNFEKFGGFLHARSSASTTVSTLSEQSGTSSRYPSSTFTRLTNSSSSSWQASVDSQQPVTITLNDKESVVTAVNSMAVTSSCEPTVDALKQEVIREGHSRAQSDATLLMTTAPVAMKPTKESLKTHRRARTASRSHTTPSPQFALFPQISPRS